MKKYKKGENNIRDAMTNKLVGNKEVVMLENAIDYVKKQGYIVVRPRLIREVTMTVLTCLTLILVYGVRL